MAIERSLKGEGVALAFSSLCRFPLYDADFGYGEPIWVSSADRCYGNIFGFLDNKKCDKIEAYACFSPHEMAKLEWSSNINILVVNVGAMDSDGVLIVGKLNWAEWRAPLETNYYYGAHGPIT
ncbi:hypothetical protein CsatB_022435 [Cannabis sativa]